ncbi:MAG: 5-deoxy-glucuronate isomerase [Intestinibacillus sp.]
MKYTSKGPFVKGYNAMITDQNPEMMGMDFGVYKMDAGDKANFNYAQEVVYDLLCGKVTFSWEGKNETVEREDCFHVGPIVLHVPENTAVSIECLSDEAEIAITKTENSKKFESRLLQENDLLCANEKRGFGIMNDCSTRLVRTFFDRSNCPETNFFIGEVVHDPGKWSSYPPHHHVEPELYYYKFLPDDGNGYGYGEINDEVHKLHNNDLTGMPKGATHSQVAAPGYSMFYLWAIRLRDDKNINTINDPRFTWAAQPDAKFFPDI